jgi:hypothetical protein
MKLKSRKCGHHWVVTWSIFSYTMNARIYPETPQAPYRESTCHWIQYSIYTIYLASDCTPYRVQSEPWMPLLRPSVNLNKTRPRYSLRKSEYMAGNLVARMAISSVQCLTRPGPKKGGTEVDRTSGLVIPSRSPAQTRDRIRHLSGSFLIWWII